MARSPLTLAAAVTEAVPGARIVGARRLTAGGSGRYDSAIATLGDGREAVVKVPADDDVDHELSEQVLALRALTPGVRELLGVEVPEYLGATSLSDARAVVTTMLPGYQIEAGEIPPGDGAARSIGRTLAAIHALPASVVRSAGLRERTPADSRADAERVLDAAAASRRLPVRLTVRWREAIEDDRLWAFESTVGLGGATSDSFIFGDDERDAPIVTGVLDWHGLSIDDPAVDLRWVASAPDAERDILAAYTEAAHRAPDNALHVRARFHAEMEFARWLVHGVEAHRDDIVDDAAALLESLADGVRDSFLLDDLPRDGETDVDDAIALISSVRAAEPADPGGTAMETDAYTPDELTLSSDVDWGDEHSDRRSSPDEATSSGSDHPAPTEPLDLADLQRETMSSSEDTTSPRRTRSSDT